MSMFTAFQFVSLPLKDILLDKKNPRIVTQKPLSTQKEILEYLYNHEDLDTFVKKIATEGHNAGAERPYVIANGNSGYVVIEGNTRIAAYKLLTGLLKPLSGYSVPQISEAAKTQLLTVACSIAPDREALMPIMASAHFGMGDKSKWGYLGSRKAVFDEWSAGNPIPKIAKIFKVSQSDVRQLILEYQLYLKTLKLGWNKDEKAALLNPNVAFNPPVRFLQTGGHKEKMGISYDTNKLKVVLASGADEKLKHLVRKLVIEPVPKLGATASYENAFIDFKPGKSGKKKATGTKPSGKGRSSGGKGGTPKTNALFNYTPKKINSALITQLMKEAKDINAEKFKACGVLLLRSIVEAILKHIIDDQNANKGGKTLDLEGAINLASSNAVSLPNTDKKVLSEFRKEHLTYLNFGSHGNVVPNETRIFQARDAIDQFVKKHV